MFIRIITVLAAAAVGEEMTRIHVSEREMEASDYAQAKGEAYTEESASFVPELALCVACAAALHWSSSKKSVVKQASPEEIKQTPSPRQAPVRRVPPTDRRVDRAAVQNNHKICACDRAEEILSLVGEIGHTFNEVNLATALHRVAKHCKRSRRDSAPLLARPEMETLLTMATARLPDFNVQGVSNAFWALATLKVAPENHPELVAQLRTVAAGRVAEFQPQGLANTAWACATLGIQDPALMEQLSLSCLKSLNAFNTQDLANVAWAFATVHHTADDLFTAIAAAAIPQLDQFNPQELSNIVWSFKARRQPQQDAKFFVAVAECAATRTGALPMSALVNLVWSFASAGVTHKGFLEAVTNAVVGRSGGMTAQDLATLLWSAATLKYRDERLLEAAGSLILRLAPEMTGHDISNAVWALATLRYRHRAALDRLAEEALAQRARLQPQAVSNVLWGFATVGHAHKEMFVGLGEVLITQAPRYNAAQIVASATAMSKHGSPEAMAALASAASQILPNFNPNALVTLADSFAAPQYAGLLREIRSRLQEIGARLAQRQEAMLSQAMASAGVDAC